MVPMQNYILTELIVGIAVMAVVRQEALSNTLFNLALNGIIKKMSID